MEVVFTYEDYTGGSGANFRDPFTIEVLNPCETSLLVTPPLPIQDR